jgi:predicted ATP-grasp superfamily ATP-dependent carboligase
MSSRPNSRKLGSWSIGPFSSCRCHGRDRPCSTCCCCSSASGSAASRTSWPGCQTHQRPSEYSAGTSEARRIVMHDSTHAADLAPWRAHKVVLVSDAQAIGSVAAIRSLGRAGYRVVACSTSENALGMFSRYCSVPLVQPHHPAEFFDWLKGVVTQYQVGLIIPSEGFLLRLRPHLQHFHALLPIPGNESLAFAGLSKFDLFKMSAEHGLTDALPPYLLLDDTRNLPDAAQLDAIGSPLFVKADAVYSTKGHASQVFRCKDGHEAWLCLRSLRGKYSKLLVQAFVPGVGVGAFIARWNGDELGAFMHRRLHEVPHTGGFSSYRESWRDDRILEDARRRMKCLRWQGVGMFEYRWNPIDDKFYLLEFNSRFWGSLHLALFAGVDFPLAIADAFFGKMPAAPAGYRNVRSRLTFPAEVGYLLSRLRDSSLTVSERIGTSLAFVGLGLNPRVHSDLWFPGDRTLYWRAMYRSLRNLLR